MITGQQYSFIHLSGTKGTLDERNCPTLKLPQDDSSASSRKQLLYVLHCNNGATAQTLWNCNILMWQFHVLFNTATFTCSTPSTAVPTYTLPGPGMYSVVLEVTDSVGNTAVARRLLLWDSQSAVSTNPKRPMSVLDLTSVTEEGETYVWVTSAIDKDHPVTVTWPDHFENSFHHNNKLLNKVNLGKADRGISADVMARFNVFIENLYNNTHILKHCKVSPPSVETIPIFLGSF